MKWLTMAAFLAMVVPALADSQGDALAKALEAAPPVVPMTETRQAVLSNLDDWIGRPASDHTEPVIEYYREAVDRALSKIEGERVESGVRIFQLYSSSYIVQTPETVFAIDLDQGPNHGIDQTPENEGDPFCLRDDQIARIAEAVDYSFHTHEHDDHVDYEIVRALVDAEKTVIVTESNKELWASQPWHDKLVVLEQTVRRPLEVGPLKVDVLWDHQWNNSMHTSGTPCDAFVVATPGGVTVMTKGDINCGLQLYGWLSLLKNRGQKIDVMVGSPIYWRGVPTIREINDLFTPLWLPGHCWEFTHRDDDEPKGNCLAYVQSWNLIRAMAGSNKVQPLSWGEWIDVPAK